MLKKEASAIVGGLSTPGKMPCYSINLPATECKVGSILAKAPGTTCYGCYALKGRYRFKKTKEAMARRLRALVHGSWTAAMITLITGHKYLDGTTAATFKDRSISKTSSKLPRQHQTPSTGCQRASISSCSSWTRLSYQRIY